MLLDAGEVCPIGTVLVGRRKCGMGFDDWLVAVLLS